MVKARVLRKLVPLGSVQQDDGTYPTATYTTEGEGWNIITSNLGGQAFVWDGYIDLAGYLREEQTWFSQSVQIQGCDYPVIMSPTIGGFIPYVDIVSEVPLTNEDLVEASIGIFFPGCTQSEANLSQIIWGRTRYYSIDNTLSGGVGTGINTGTTFFGLNNGTARDKLYLYRIIPLTQLGLSEVLAVGESAFVISGAVDEEKDLEYIMRLKRSYEETGPFS